MATLFLVNVPILPSKPIKSVTSPNVVYSPQTSIAEEYSTPRTSAQTDQVSSCGSDSPTIEQDSSEITDTEDSVDSPDYTRQSKTEIQIKLENDEAEFFAYSPSKTCRRKRDRIRAAFSRKFDRSESTESETSTGEWNTMLSKALISMQTDIHKIIASLDEVDNQLSLEDVPTTSTGTDQIRSHLSFHERQYEKLQLMRLAEMLHPPNLLTCETNECPYAYTDIIALHKFKHLRARKGVPDENLYVQCKPLQHRKCQYRTQRGLLRMKKDLKKIRRDIRGTKSSQSSPHVPTQDAINYRQRLERTLVEFRRQMAESNLCETMMKPTEDHSKIQTQIDEYRMKSKNLNCPGTNELISAPYIPPRKRNRKTNALENKENIDPRFDPTTIADLTEKSEEFFGQELPFWDVPLNRRLSVALSFDPPAPVRFNLVPKKGLWDRFVISFKSKQKLLHSLQTNQRRHSSDDSLIHSEKTDDIFYDCVSLQKFHSYNDIDSVDF